MNDNGNLNNRRIKDPKFLMVFPPMQFSKDEMVRPDGTLGLPYLDASLTQAGFHSQILDMSIGTPKDKLEDTFYKQIPISNNLVQIGMSEERILEEVRDFDVIGLTSLFTQQTSQCIRTAKLIKKHYPEKIIISGGVNARSLKELFFDSGIDVIFISEAEKPIVNFAKFLAHGKPSLSEISGIAFRQNGKIVISPARETVENLDELPMPSWEKLPYKRYWEIGRIWGGREGWIDHDGPVPYAAIFTSRGCVFDCTYCHISKEWGGESGEIGKLRLHSIPRVEQEFEKLKSMGVKYIYINDDTFLAKKNRVFSILQRLKHFDFRLANVSGINIIHFFKQQSGKMVVDVEMLENLYEAGFRKISLPFESATQRIIDKYAGAKWRIDKCDTLSLIKRINEVGIVADGNFMIGYPDESMEELTNTFLFARDHMDAGMVACQFFMVQPFPGTMLYDDSVAKGILPTNMSWDEMGWSKGSIFTSLQIDKQILKHSWSLVWKLLNRSSRVKEFTGQLVKS